MRSFEPKRYENLSHAPNKAMNLNTYIGLLGRRLAEENRPDGLYLVPDASAVSLPTAKYLVTLDADSILVPEYVEVLAGIMETPGQERVAVIQTPYAATPGAVSALERIAGATTDVQRLLHQGYTRFNGTFWVGANAVLRVEALQDIRQQFTERGHKLFRYIQDRTVIEDTEFDDRSHPAGMDAVEPSGGAGLFGNATRLRRTRHTATPVGVRRSPALPKAVTASFSRDTRSPAPGNHPTSLPGLAWVPAAVIALSPFRWAMQSTLVCCLQRCLTTLPTVVICERAAGRP